MERIVTEDGREKAPVVELPGGTTAYLVVGFNAETGQFAVKMDGAMPPELLYFQLAEFQQRVMAACVQRRQQQAAAEQALRVQAAGPGYPFGK